MKDTLTGYCLGKNLVAELIMWHHLPCKFPTSRKLLSDVLPAGPLPRTFRSGSRLLPSFTGHGRDVPENPPRSLLPQLFRSMLSLGNDQTPKTNAR